MRKLHFDIYGPYDVSRKNKLVSTNAQLKKNFWEDVEEKEAGLPDACGAYVFVVKGGRGALPWYVGLTTKRTFRHECLGAHQVNLYNQAISDKTGRPQLFLLAKKTSEKRFAKPSGNSHIDIKFLETFLISTALKRNAKLLNMRQTKHLRSLVVPGIINSPQRFPRPDEKKLKKALGL